MFNFSSDPEDGGLNLANLPLEAKLTLELSDFAQQVEVNCAEFLLAPPQGIYLRNRLEPVMVDGCTYYTYKGNKSVPIVDINTVKDNVYSDAGKLVVPKMFMENKAKFLSDTPFIPYRGIKLAELLITEQVDSMMEYRQRRAPYPLRKIMAHMLPQEAKVVEDWSAEAALVRQLATQLQGAPGPQAEAIQVLADKLAQEHPEETITARLEACYADLRKEITLFMGNNTWNIYFVKLNNTTVSIERYMDYRIYSWEVEHGQAFRRNARH